LVEKNKGLIFFGIILLAIGLVAFFYSQTEYSVLTHAHVITYPYQNTGILLIATGIEFVALELLYSSRKSAQENKNSSLRKRGYDAR